VTSWRDGSLTKHGSGHGRVKSLGDLDDKVSRGSVVVGIPTVTLLALGFSLVELSSVCALSNAGRDRSILRVPTAKWRCRGDTYDHLGTPVLLLLVTLVAIVTRIALSSHTDGVANLDVGHLGSNTDGFTDEFVSNDSVGARQKGGQSCIKLQEGNKRSKTH
jgi:hypothetical protein